MLKQLLNTSVSPNKYTSVSARPMPYEKLPLSELNYRNLFESMEEGFANCQMIYDKDRKPVDFRYLYVNPAFAKQTGLPVERVVGHTVKEVIPKIEPFWIETYGRVVASGKSEHFENKMESIGKQFEIKAWPSGEKCFAVVLEDITDRKKIEEEAKTRTNELEQLSRSQEETKKAMLNVMEDLQEAKNLIEIEKVRDEAMLASIGDGFVAMDSIGKIVLVNKAFEDILGWKEPEVVGKMLTQVVPMIDENATPIPQQERLITKVLTNHPQTTTTTTTTFYKRKDGAFFPVSITISPIVKDAKIIGAVEVFHDITREKEIDLAKSEFASLASHQLRTPLGIVKWYIEALQKSYVKNSPKNVQDYFNEIEKSNDRVLTIVGDLLAVSRIDQGRVRNNPKLVNIAEIVTDIVRSLQVLAKKKKITLQLDVKQQKLPSIYIDPTRFYEVVENLVVNAIEYTPVLGSVKVSVEKSDDKILIEVKDSGIGISKEDQKKLFTKFFRSNNAAKTNQEGSGLGLYVAKAYVEGWGGEVFVESTEGKGSSFTISLPISKNERGLAPPKPWRRGVIEDEKNTHC